MKAQYTRQITLDMVVGNTRNRMNRICIQGEARDEIKKYGLQSVIIEEQGPAGGNPVVRLRGSYTGILAYLTNVYCLDDKDELKRCVGMIEHYTGVGEMKQAVL